MITALLLPLVLGAVELPRTQTITLESKQTGETYEILVALPRDHGSRAEPFPVIYTLDAAYSFAIARNVVEHLSDRGGLPPAIVVGIGYPGGIEGEGWLRRYRLQRTRDYTPVKSAEGYGGSVQDVSGGGEKFAAFLEKELVPLIDSRFRTAHGDRAVIGHSYGGLFASWVMIAHPGLFTRAVIVSPSLWYDDRYLFRLEKERRPKTDRRLPANVFFAVGSREATKDRDMVADLKSFARQLTDAKYEGLRVRTRVFEDETHDSIFPAAMSRGLRDVFDQR